MHVITRSCVLFLWMHTLTFVKSQDCTLVQFLNGPLFDSNFDTTDLEASYSGGKQVRVSCNVGYSGFFKLICVEGKWQSRGTKCQPKSCGHPGDAQFADFQLEKGDDFVFGSQVVYTCHKGYQMVSRTNYRRCMAEGWDGVVPVCEAQQCPVIHVDNNVQVSGDPEEATYGNVVRFSCKSSTEVLSGSPEMYCDENGEWSGQAPKCQAISCAVPQIENGNVPGNIQEYKEHDVLYYQCNPKYIRAEKRPSKCTKLGIRAEWNPMPLCELVKCRLPPSLEGTRYEPAFRNVFSPGDTVRVICGEKYWISNPQDSSAVTICKEDGEWTVRPVCQEVICSNRRPQSVNSWNVYWGQQVKMGETTSYWCKTGYKKTGGANWATCTRDGWKPDPLCQAITCDRHDVQNADIVYNNKQTYRYNEQARYVCKGGYEGRFTLTCGNSGWTGNAQCTEKTCDRQDYQTADIVGNYQYQYRYNEQVEYVCKNGNEGRFTLTCGETGWIGSPRCTKRQCKKLDIDNAYITHHEKETYSHNERVQYACRHDGEKVFTVTCEQSVWTGIQSCAACPNANVPHGFVVGPYNNTLYYTCDEGHKLSTKGWWAEAKCNDGVWSGLHLCIENSKCGETPVIPHGEVRLQRTQIQSAQIICKEGYSAQIDHLTCHQGKWQLNGLPAKTICTPISKPCNPPPKVVNAVVVTPYQKEYLSDSAVTYRCRDKYTIIEGEDTILCKNGTWETKNIKCTPYCDKLQDEMIIFTADKERYMDGEVIEYQCVIPGGKGIATCVNTKWNKSTECKAITCDRHDVQNADIVYNNKQTYRYNEQARYVCKGGYEGRFTLTCGNSGWTGNAQCTAATQEK